MGVIVSQTLRWESVNKQQSEVLTLRSGYRYVQLITIVALATEAQAAIIRIFKNLI